MVQSRDSNSEVILDANQSASRKFTRRTIELPIDESDEEILLINDIYSNGRNDVDPSQVEDDDADEEDEDEEDEDDENVFSSAEERDNINSKSQTLKKLGKPTQKQRKKRKDALEEPPSHLAPNDRYFWDNKPGAHKKTSDNVLPANFLLNHDEYFAQRDAWQDHHLSHRQFLLKLHQKAFHQWAYELRDDFNICLYGYGSKRPVIAAFADYLYQQDESSDEASIVIINGFRSDITLSHILTTVASLLIPNTVKLPPPNALLSFILETLTAKPPKAPIYLLIHSLDGAALRRGNSIQAALATLTSHTWIQLVASVDMPNVLQLWDTSLRSRFHFLFHDCTTFVPFDTEIDAVESINELLGRSGRRLGGRDGVAYVLRSLPENARQLFRILVAEQISAATAEDASGASGVEYRHMYQRAKEELVCSTEHQLNTLLKEFYDHQMVESRRDAVGVEWLQVPFRKEELESLLEDLVE